MSTCWCGSLGEGLSSRREAVPLALWRCRAEQFPAAVAAEQEDENGPVLPQLRGVVGRGEPGGRKGRGQRLMRPVPVALAPPGNQRGLQRLDALERAVRVQQLTLQGLMQPLDLPGKGGERTLVSRWMIPTSRQIRSNSTSTGTPGL